VNKAFTNNFGYNNEDIRGKNFSILFTDSDKQNNKPEHEIETVLLNGQSSDENYIINKDGHAIWCTGESLLVVSEDRENYIVKDIINLQAKKQLPLFLRGTEELLERIFETSKDIPMMVLNGVMKVQRVNTAFLNLFEIEKHPALGSRLSDLNTFWNNDVIRNEIRKILVTNKPLRGMEFILDTKSGAQKTIKIDSRIINNHTSDGKEIYLILEDVIS
jgi:PAS domain S-box-containing protein